MGSHPVDVFASLEVVAKALQFLSLALFFGADGRRGTVVAFRASQLGVLGSCLSLGFLVSPGWWLCLLGICMNYIMHAFIWNCPREFEQLCKGPLKAMGSHPVDVFASLEAIVGAPGWCWLVLLLFVAAGQTLNFAMYG